MVQKTDLSIGLKFLKLSNIDKFQEVGFQAKKAGGGDFWHCRSVDDQEHCQRLGRASQPGYTQDAIAILW